MLLLCGPIETSQDSKFGKGEQQGPFPLALGFHIFLAKAPAVHSHGSISGPHVAKLEVHADVIAMETRTARITFIVVKYESKDIPSITALEMLWQKSSVETAFMSSNA